MDIDRIAMEGLGYFIGLGILGWFVVMTWVAFAGVRHGIRTLRHTMSTRRGTTVAH